jgi:hypothetical protein
MAGSNVKVKTKKAGKSAAADAAARMPKKLYEAELFRLQAELVPSGPGSW